MQDTAQQVAEKSTDYPSWTTNIVIKYDLKDFVSNKNVKIQCRFLPNTRPYNFTNAFYGYSTQQLCQLFPCRLQPTKSIFINLRKEVVYTRLW